MDEAERVSLNEVVEALTSLVGDLASVISGLVETNDLDMSDETAEVLQRLLPRPWTDLPAAGRPGPAPELPAYGEWPAATKAAWAELWKTPQATQWHQGGQTLFSWARLHAEYDRLRLQADPIARAEVARELRAIEDSHGLNPLAMMTLRWRIAEERPDLHLVEDDPPPPADS